MIDKQIQALRKKGKHGNATTYRVLTKLTMQNTENLPKIRSFQEEQFQTLVRSK